MIEIVIVVGIILVFAAIAIPIYFSVIEKTKAVHCQDTRSTAVTQYGVYNAMGGTINPDGLHDMEFLVDAEYIIVEKSCINGGEYTWVVAEGESTIITCSEHE